MQGTALLEGNIRTLSVQSDISNQQTFTSIWVIYRIHEHWGSQSLQKQDPNPKHHLSNKEHTQPYFNFNICFIWQGPVSMTTSVQGSSQSDVAQLVPALQTKGARAPRSVGVSRSESTQLTTLLCTATVSSEWLWVHSATCEQLISWRPNTSADRSCRLQGLCSWNRLNSHLHSHHDSPTVH